MVPIDSVKEDGALKCKLCDVTENDCTWIGRSEGGEHPLGFSIDNCLTIIEFDTTADRVRSEYNEKLQSVGDMMTLHGLLPARVVSK